MKSWISHCSDLGELFHHCISEKPSQILPSSECWLPLKHFEVNHSWQFYYKYVALVIVAWKVMEKICKDIKLDFSSAENGKKKMLVLKLISWEMCISSQKNQIWFIIYFGNCSFWSGKKKRNTWMYSFHFTYVVTTHYLQVSLQKLHSLRSKLFAGFWVLLFYHLLPQCTNTTLTTVPLGISQSSFLKGYRWCFVF